MARSLGTKLHRTTSYHPQAHGMVGLFHRSLKASLQARLHDGNWIDELPWVLLGLRTATKEDLQTSPAEMVFGDSPLLPGEFASSGKTPFFPSFTETSTTSPQHHRVDTPTLARSKYVFVRVGPQHPSLQRPYQGPFKVIQTGNKTFKVLMNKGPQTILLVLLLVLIDSNLQRFHHRHKHEQVGLLTSLIAGIIEHLNVH